MGLISEFTTIIGISHNTGSNFFIFCRLPIESLQVYTPTGKTLDSDSVMYAIYNNIQSVIIYRLMYITIFFQ